MRRDVDDIAQIRVKGIVLVGAPFRLAEPAAVEAANPGVSPTGVEAGDEAGTEESPESENTRTGSE